MLHLAGLTSQLILFAGVSHHVADSNTRNKILTSKLLKQGYPEAYNYSSRGL